MVENCALRRLDIGAGREMQYWRPQNRRFTSLNDSFWCNYSLSGCPLSVSVFELPYLLGYKTGISSPQNDPKYVNPMKACYKMGSPVQNNLKNLEPSYKTDLDI